MAVVTSDFLAGIFTNFRVVWEDSFLAASSAATIDRFATTVPSNTDTESYSWLGTVPKMQEWLDERQVSGLAAYNYSIKNKPFEATIEVDRDTFEDDRYNQIRPRVQQLGEEAARYPLELAMATLVAGGATAGYDSVNFFSASHTEESSGAQVNTAAGTGVTLAAIRADLIAARTRMRKLVDGRARVMNLAPDLVIIPPELQDVFEQLINTNLIANNSVAMSNNLLNAVDIQVNSFLTDANDWFLMSTRSPIKPLIYQLRKAPEFVAIDDPKAETVFRRKKFLYGVDARFNFGYGLWQMAQRITN